MRGDFQSNDIVIAITSLYAFTLCCWSFKNIQLKTKIGHSEGAKRFVPLKYPQICMEDKFRLSSAEDFSLHLKRPGEHGE